MGKKRKSVATRLDEVDRTMYATFCSAANSLSQLYTQTMNQQKLSFQAGERHGLEKLYHWILRQQEAGSRVTTVDILTYLQNELDYCGEEPSVSPRAPFHHQPSQPTMHLTNSGFQVPSGASVQNQGTRPDSDQQPKNSVFSNALSSPVRRTLQHYHFPQGGGGGGYYPNSGLASATGARNSDPNFLHQANRDSNPLSSNDSSMDMHADSPGHESTY